MVRTPCRDTSGLKKGTWTPEEDSKLIAYVTRYGSWNWRQLPRFAGLARCGKSCRLRWLNYLRPNIKRGNYTQEEDDIIIRQHQNLGSRWSVIATHLPGRTDNEIKNHWHTNLKKCCGKNLVRTNENFKAPKPKTYGSRDSMQNNGLCHSSSFSTTSKTSDSGPLSPQLSSSETSDFTTNDNLLLEYEFDFVDACLVDAEQNISTESHVGNIYDASMSDNGNGSDATRCMDAWPWSNSNENLVVENEDFAFLEAIQPITANFWTEAYTADMSLVPNELLAPFVNQSEECFSSTYEADLWCQTNSSDLNANL